ncbi:hypothetical protein KO481_03995 [Nocardia sp. NEAU-G5]|uniref:Uncharacterized protein n=1 Tax=Nocardia albiluteola TaxID=2842303 RepID=A0ABS6AS17_9NOCA|nr:DUF6086 family protein [Nocardia albiluteola]MBU3060683.1 hypothetical protein [Nocardia albiluteola]
MSYVFDVGDVTVWSPSLRVGNLYVRIVSGISEVLEIPTGLHPLASDFYDIDIDVFEHFVRAMFDLYVSASHDILKSMIEGVMLPSLVMLDRAGRGIIPTTTAEAAILSKASELSMAR